MADAILWKAKWPVRESGLSIRTSVEEKIEVIKGPCGLKRQIFTPNYFQSPSHII